MKRNMVPRKLGAAVLILTLCLSLMVTGAWAAEPSLEGNWTDNGNYDISWYNDTDSEFTLSDAADLAGLAVLVPEIMSTIILVGRLTEKDTLSLT